MKMKTRQILRLGYFIPQRIVSDGSSDNDNLEQIADFFADKGNIPARFTLTLLDFLLFHFKKFDSVSLLITRYRSRLLPNGTMIGIEGLVARSEVDIAMPLALVNEENENVEFCYSGKLSSSTFFTVKPRYKQQSVGVLQAFTLPLWITTISVLFAMILLYYFLLKRKYTFDKISFHIVTIFLRQSAIVGHSSLAEKLLLCSWVIGAMFLCLSFESVFFAFLAVPHVREIKDVAQLVEAVTKGEYHCYAYLEAVHTKLLLESNVESLRIIGEGIMKNTNAFMKM